MRSHVVPQELRGYHLSVQTWRPRHLLGLHRSLMGDLSTSRTLKCPRGSRQCDPVRLLNVPPVEARDDHCACVDLLWLYLPITLTHVLPKIPQILSRDVDLRLFWLIVRLLSEIDFLLGCKAGVSVRLCSAPLLPLQNARKSMNMAIYLGNTPES